MTGTSVVAKCLRPIRLQSDLNISVKAADGQVVCISAYRPHRSQKRNPLHL